MESNGYLHDNSKLQAAKAGRHDMLNYTETITKDIDKRRACNVSDNMQARTENTPTTAVDIETLAAELCVY